VAISNMQTDNLSRQLNRNIRQAQTRHKKTTHTLHTTPHTLEMTS